MKSAYLKKEVFFMINKLLKLLILFLKRSKIANWSQFREILKSEVEVL